jgi:CubicO group peptidase (beta-lactamase class C family)
MLTQSTQIKQTLFWHRVPLMILGIAVLILAGVTNVASAASLSQVEDGQAYIIQADDWLSKLADKFYGDPLAWPVIWEATNAKAAADSSFAVIDNPDVIEVGQKVWIPAIASLSEVPVATPVTTKPPKVTADMLAEFEVIFETERQNFNVPGAAVAIVQDGEIVYVQGFGVRNLETGEPVTPETVFRIGSVTKSMTAMMVATLVDEGKFDWETPVVELVPDFKLPNEELTQKVKVRQLMGMGTGLTDGINPLYWGSYSAKELFDSLAASEILGNGTAAEIGQTFYYNNHLYATAGYIDLLAEGVAYEALLDGYKALMKERVYDPIGMETAAITDDPSSISDNYAVSYEISVLGDPDAPVQVARQLGGTIAPAGGTSASVIDLARYLITQLNRGVAPDGTQVVSADNLMETWQVQTSTPSPPYYVGDLEGYAMGWSVQTYNGLRVIHHTGSIGGFKAELAFLPEENIGIAVVINGISGEQFTTAMWYTVLDLLYGFEKRGLEANRNIYQKKLAALSEAAASVESPTVDAEAVAPYLGGYERGWFVELHDDQTLWVVNGNGWAFNLLPTANGYINGTGGGLGTGHDFAFIEGDDGSIMMSIGGFDEVRKIN